MQTKADSIARAGSLAFAPSRVGRFRWVICALLFFITTINYMDRQIIGVLKPVLAQDLHWSEIDYGNIVFFFQLAYAAGYVGMGRFMDLVGVRFGLTVAVIIWSLAAAGHGLARSVFGFGLAPSSWASARAATSRRRSRRSATGSRSRSGPSRPASSTPGATSARC